MERQIIALLKKSYHFIKGTTPLQSAPPDIIISDEFVDWLSFANAGMLNRGNIYCIDYVAKHLSSDNPIIEIGSFCGLSTNLINYYLFKYGKKNRIITSDKWEFENKKEMVGDSIISHAKYKEFVKESFKRNLQLFSSFNLPYPIEVYSDDFFELWENNVHHKDVFGRTIQLGGNISFAFIDGNHTYEYAKRDFQNTDKYLEPGGFILFDDSSDHSPFECRLLMNEIEVNPQYELVIKNPNYLFRKVT